MAWASRSISVLRCAGAFLLVVFTTGSALEACDSGAASPPADGSTGMRCNLSAGCLTASDCPSGSYCGCTSCGITCGMCFESLDNCGDPNFGALTLCDTEGGCPNGGTCNVDAGNGAMACGGFARCNDDALAPSGSSSSLSETTAADAGAADAAQLHDVAPGDAGSVDGPADVGSGDAFIVDATVRDASLDDAPLGDASAGDATLGDAPSDAASDAAQPPDHTGPPIIDAASGADAP